MSDQTDACPRCGGPLAATTDYQYLVRCARCERLWPAAPPSPARAAEPDLRERIEAMAREEERSALALAVVARGSTDQQARDSASRLAADRTRTAALLRSLLSPPPTAAPGKENT